MANEEGFYALLYRIMAEQGVGPNRLWLTAGWTVILFAFGVCSTL